MRTTSNKITVQQLRYLLKTAEAASVTDAARELGISQSTLSEALSQVESIVGFSILERSRKGVKTTDLGNEFLEYAQVVVNNMDDLERRFVAGAPKKYRFHIASQSFKFAWDSLVELSQTTEFANYDLSWNLGATMNVVEEVASGKADIGLIGITSTNRKPITKLLSDNNVYFTPAVTTPLYAMMSTSHPLAQKGVSNVTYEELADYPQFNFEQYVHLELQRANDASRRHGDGRKRTSSAYDISIPNGIIVSPTQLIHEIVGANGYIIWSHIASLDVVYNLIDSWPINTEERKHFEKLTVQMNSLPGDIAIFPIEKEESMEIGYILKNGHFLSAAGQQFIDAIANFKG